MPWRSLANGGEKMMQALADVEMTWVEKAWHEGQRKLLLRLLTLRFGELPEAG